MFLRVCEHAVKSLLSEKNESVVSREAGATSRLSSMSLLEAHQILRIRLSIVECHVDGWIRNVIHCRVEQLAAISHIWCECECTLDAECECECTLDAFVSVSAPLM